MDFRLFQVISFGIIDLIRMFRNVAHLGLAESKGATERFLSVYNISRNTDDTGYDFGKTTLHLFVKYAGLFADGTLVMENGEVYPCARQTVSDTHIMNVLDK